MLGNFCPSAGVIWTFHGQSILTLNGPLRKIFLQIYNCARLHSSQERQLRALLYLGELKAAIKLRPQLGLHVDLIGEGPVLRNSQCGPLNFVIKSRGRNFKLRGGIYLLCLQQITNRILLLVYCQYTH